MILFKFQILKYNPSAALHDSRLYTVISFTTTANQSPEATGNIV